MPGARKSGHESHCVGRAHPLLCANFLQVEARIRRKVVAELRANKKADEGSVGLAPLLAPSSAKLHLPARAFLLGCAPRV
jgi:hypothetical protein